MASSKLCQSFSCVCQCLPTFTILDSFLRVFNFLLYTIHSFLLWSRSWTPVFWSLLHNCFSFVCCLPSLCVSKPLKSSAGIFVISFISEIFFIFASSLTHNPNLDNKQPRGCRLRSFIFYFYTTCRYCLFSRTNLKAFSFVLRQHIFATSSPARKAQFFLFNCDDGLLKCH